MASNTKQASLQYTNDNDDVIRYKFDIVNSEELTIESQVTNYTVEDGSMRQEHVVLPPIEFVLQGVVAEKAYRHEPLIADSFIAQQVGKLQPIAALLPEVSSYAQAAIAATNYVERNIRQTVNKVKNLQSLWKRSPNLATNTKVQRVIAGELRVLRDLRRLVKITSDLGVFDNMLIESVRMTQEETADQSQLIVKLKQYTSVATELTYINTKDYADRCAQQAAGMENLGRIQGRNMSMLRNLVPQSIVPYFTGVQ